MFEKCHDNGFDTKTRLALDASVIIQKLSETNQAVTVAAQQKEGTKGEVNKRCVMKSRESKKSQGR